jgi:hypothetical protein
VDENGLYECANLFVSRELFERLGGFEVRLVPRFGKPFAEDVWFGARARRSAALLAAGPYALTLRRRIRPYGPATSAKLVIVDLVGNSLGLASVVPGSLTARRLVL